MKRSRTRSRGGSKPLWLKIQRMFASGLVGAIYDFKIPFLTQVSDGTTPVAAETDPIGRAIDRSPSANHAIQATADARPTYQLDAAGLPYAEFLGTDDNLTSATGGGGDAGFFFCAAIKPTGGAGTVRMLFDDRGTNTGYRVNLNTLNLLILAAGNGSAETRRASTATVDVGTGYVLTAWDDGTNLNVQINNGTALSIARPVVAAGTTGFTIGKTNGAASNYLIADVYHMAYAKNTGLTAAERATIQQYAASKIGITL